MIPGSGRSPGGGHGNPLQYSCLGNPMGRGAWQAPVPEVTKSHTQVGMHAQPGLRMAPNPVTVSSGEKPWTRRQRGRDAATSPGKPKRQPCRARRGAGSRSRAAQGQERSREQVLRRPEPGEAHGAGPALPRARRGAGSRSRAGPPAGTNAAHTLSKCCPQNWDRRHLLGLTQSAVICCYCSVTHSCLTL